MENLNLPSVPETLLSIQVGQVNFPMYQELKDKANEILDYMNTVVVTEDTVKANKKLVAELSKVSKRLDTERKNAKKAILAPFEQAEAEIKEINAIIAQADNAVRSQIRELEEMERAEKEESLLQEWNNRIDSYPNVKELFGFDAWLKPTHLNKTTSNKKCIEDMAQWLEQTKRDIEFIKEQKDEQNIPRYLAKYAQTLDVIYAIQSIQSEIDRESTLKQTSISEQKPVITESIPSMIIKIEGLPNIIAAKKVLKENGIEYKEI